MKYTNFSSDRYGFFSEEAVQYWNFGDQIQILTVDRVVEQTGIHESNIVRVSSSELGTWDGDELVFPVNSCVLRTQGDGYRWTSDRVLPVFLGVNLQVPELTEEMVHYFKKYEPIGCRDEATLKILERYEVRGYLNGCLTATFPKRSRELGQDKVFFIDIPEELKTIIPEDIASRGLFLSNNYYGRLYDLAPGKRIAGIVEDRYRKISDEAALVVTSRLHVASPCAAMGVPVILVKNEYPSTFSWIERIVPTYTKSDFSSIDWSPVPAEFETVKHDMLKLAYSRLKRPTYFSENQEQIAQRLTEFWLNRKRVAPLEGNSIFDTLTAHLNSKYTLDESFEYSIWGVNDIADALYHYVNRNFPKGKLKYVYDKYNHITFHGIQSKSPDCMSPSDSEEIIVCVMSAMIEAKATFERHGKRLTELYCPVSIDENMNMHIKD